MENGIQNIGRDGLCADLLTSREMGRHGGRPSLKMNLFIVVSKGFRPVAAH